MFHHAALRLGLVLLLVASFTLPLPATWSILIVDTVTGEVALGIATCLTGFDLRPATVVIVPGRGVAAAQSFVGPLALRQLIREQLLAGTPPSQILALLASNDPGHQTRQYGIVDVAGGTSTFTGSGAGAFAGGLTGASGSLVYAIQGNVLTGLPVLSNAEQALLNTAGDVGQKLMAAMDAARLAGGDGRCSCSPSNPTGCGAPPPNFSKSSHIGLVIVSRPGDGDAPCSGTTGCGGGSYYLDLNVANQSATALDPVLQLQALYGTWRASQIGRTDHFRSSIAFDTPMLFANGNDGAQAIVQLRDLQGGPVTTMPAVAVTIAPMSEVSDAALGPVVALGGGQFAIPITSGFTSGRLLLDVVATDAQGSVLLSPRAEIPVVGPFGPCGDGTVEDGFGGRVNVLTVDGSAGIDRIVTRGFGEPFVLAMAAAPLQPPGPGLAGHFALYGLMGAPSLSNTLALGTSIGSLCFVPPPWSSDPGAFLVADTVSGGGALLATAAPWTTNVGGIPAVLDLTLQGILVQGDVPLDLAVTNAILLRIRPLATPTLTAVNPRSAPANGTVTLTGTNFAPGLTVDVGGTSVVPQSVTPTAVVFSMPPGVGCDALITVTNPDGQSVNVTVNPTPVIVNTVLGSGTVAGGVNYLIVGQHLLGSSVTIGGASATVTSQAETFLFVLTPPGQLGAAPVVVTTPAGCTATATYTYL